MKRENLGHKSSKEGRDYMDLLQSSSVSYDKIPGPKGLGLYARKFLCVKHMDSQGDPWLGPSLSCLSEMLHVLFTWPFLVSPTLSHLVCWENDHACFSLQLHYHCLLVFLRHSVICASIEPCVYFTEAFLSHHFTYFCLCVPLSHYPEHSWCSVRICWMSDH